MSYMMLEISEAEILPKALTQVCQKMCHGLDDVYSVSTEFNKLDMCLNDLDQFCEASCPKMERARNLLYRLVTKLMHHAILQSSHTYSRNRQNNEENIPE